MPENASAGAFVEQVRLERGAEHRDAEPERAAGLDRFGRCAEGEIGLAHVAEQRADRPGAEPEHRRAAEELLAVELALDELVDDVVLERSRLVPAELVDGPPGLSIHLSLLPSLVWRKSCPRRRLPEARPVQSLPAEHCVDPLYHQLVVPSLSRWLQNTRGGAEGQAGVSTVRGAASGGCRARLTRSTTP